MERSAQNKKIVSISLILICFSLLNIYSQDFINVRKISLSRGDTTIITGILADIKLDKVNTDLFYYWYSNSEIYSNQGGFSGNLLHGEYIEYLPDGSLYKKGYFDKGIKTGTWITWYPDGMIREECTYSNGNLSGIKKAFDEEGKLIFQARYHNGLISGKLLMMDQDTLFRYSIRNGNFIKEKSVNGR